VSGDALIVAGGAKFPDKRPWEGGIKKWYDSAFVLEQPDGVWIGDFLLPRACGYGVSITAPDGVYCIGGSDAGRHYRDVFRLVWETRRLSAKAMAMLPRPCANMSGALVGDTIYVAGGIEKPDATTCLKTFWSLNLTDEKAQWRELEPCPGPERMLAVAGAADGSFFLFSGTKLTPGPDDKPVREYLRDAWRYTPGKGWKRLADLPRPAVAAPSPAPLLGTSRLLVISGDDGTKVNFKPETQHPGFPHSVLAYDTAADAWTELPDAPFSRATAPTALWRGLIVVPSGEARPGYRSPEVWGLTPSNRLPMNRSRCRTRRRWSAWGRRLMRGSWWRCFSWSRC
jgi:N-acetylneuraminic acid mutarotase